MVQKYSIQFLKPNSYYNFKINLLSSREHVSNSLDLNESIFIERNKINHKPKLIQFSIESNGMGIKMNAFICPLHKLLILNETSLIYKVIIYDHKDRLIIYYQLTDESANEFNDDCKINELSKLINFKQITIPSSLENQLKINLFVISNLYNQTILFDEIIISKNILHRSNGNFLVASCIEDNYFKLSGPFEYNEMVLLDYCSRNINTKDMFFNEYKFKFNLKNSDSYNFIPYYNTYLKVSLVDSLLPNSDYLISTIIQNHTIGMHSLKDYDLSVSTKKTKGIENICNDRIDWIDRIEPRMIRIVLHNKDNQDDSINDLTLIRGNNNSSMNICEKNLLTRNILDFTNLVPSQSYCIFDQICKVNLFCFDTPNENITDIPLVIKNLSVVTYSSYLYLLTWNFNKQFLMQKTDIFILKSTCLKDNFTNIKYLTTLKTVIIQNCSSTMKFSLELIFNYNKNSTKTEAYHYNINKNNLNLAFENDRIILSLNGMNSLTELMVTINHNYGNKQLKKEHTFYGYENLKYEHIQSVYIDNTYDFQLIKMKKEPQNSRINYFKKLNFETANNFSNFIYFNQQYGSFELTIMSMEIDEPIVQMVHHPKCSEDLKFGLVKFFPIDFHNRNVFLIKWEFLHGNCNSFKLNEYYFNIKISFENGTIFDQATNISEPIYKIFLPNEIYSIELICFSFIQQKIISSKIYAIDLLSESSCSNIEQMSFDGFNLPIKECCNVRACWRFNVPHKNKDSNAFKFNGRLVIEAKLVDGITSSLTENIGWYRLTALEDINKETDDFERMCIGMSLELPAKKHILRARFDLYDPLCWIKNEWIYSDVIIWNNFATQPEIFGFTQIKPTSVKLLAKINKFDREYCYFYSKKDQINLLMDGGRVKMKDYDDEFQILEINNLNISTEYIVTCNNDKNYTNSITFQTQGTYKVLNVSISFNYILNKRTSINLSYYTAEKIQLCNQVIGYLIQYSKMDDHNFSDNCKHTTSNLYIVHIETYCDYKKNIDYKNEININLNDLTPFTNYLFQIRTIFTDGTLSDEVMTKEFKTIESEPDVPQLKIKNIFSNGILMEWYLCNLNGLPNKILAQYTLNNWLNNSTREISIDKTYGVIVLNKLTPNTTYNFIITVFNNNFYENSNEINYTTLLLKFPIIEKENVTLCVDDELRIDWTYFLDSCNFIDYYMHIQTACIGINNTELIGNETKNSIENKYSKQLIEINNDWILLTSLNMSCFVNNSILIRNIEERITQINQKYLLCKIRFLFLWDESENPQILNLSTNFVKAMNSSTTVSKNPDHTKFDWFLLIWPSTGISIFILTILLLYRLLKRYQLKSNEIELQKFNTINRNNYSDKQNNHNSTSSSNFFINEERKKIKYKKINNKTSNVYVFDKRTLDDRSLTKFGRTSSYNYMIGSLKSQRGSSNHMEHSLHKPKKVMIYGEGIENCPNNS